MFGERCYPGPKTGGQPSTVVLFVNTAEHFDDVRRRISCDMESVMAGKGVRRTGRLFALMDELRDANRESVRLYRRFLRQGRGQAGTLVSTEA